MAISIQDKIRAGARVVDVRTREEFVDGHYQSAVNIPVSELATRLTELGAKTDPVVLYCASGARSAAAARLLKTSGFVDVINAGGLADMPR
ncbi:MAG: rhodanese-like domain-containing protein [Deltaproteobacteria bacterium]